MAAVTHTKRRLEEEVEGAETAEEEEEVVKTELELAEEEANKRVRDIKTTMGVLIGVIGILTGIGLCCFIFAIPECYNQEPDSDEEEEEMPELPDKEDEDLPKEIQDGFVAKIVMVGASGVGKTMMWNRYTRGFIPKLNMPTKTQSEEMFESKDVRLLDSSEKEWKLQIWDTSGIASEKQSIIELFKVRKNGVIVMYDVTSLESFEIAKEWVKAAKNTIHDNVAIGLIGNKADVDKEKWQVSTEVAKAYAAEEKVSHIEISALNITMRELSQRFVNFIRFVNKRMTQGAGDTDGKQDESGAESRALLIDRDAAGLPGDNQDDGADAA